jgi:colanic acid biosynthesis glycosyl transferase WcaI
LADYKGLETLITAAHAAIASAPELPIEVLIVGNGDRVHHLKDLAGTLLGTSIVFHSHQPANLMHSLLETVDLAVVSLCPNVIRSAYPSKLMSYLQAGCRVLAIVESDSDIARLVKANDLGATSEPGDSAGVAARIVEEATRPAPAQERLRIKQFTTDTFGMTATLDRWTALYRTLTVTQGPKQ